MSEISAYAVVGNRSGNQRPVFCQKTKWYAFQQQTELSAYIQNVFVCERRSVEVWRCRSISPQTTCAQIQSSALPHLLATGRARPLLIKFGMLQCNICVKTVVRCVVACLQMPWNVSLFGCWNVGEALECCQCLGLCLISWYVFVYVHRVCVA